MKRMELKQYKGQQVSVERVYQVGDKALVDVVEVATGKKHTGLPANFEKHTEKPKATKVSPKVGKTSNQKVLFVKGNKKHEFIKDSDDYINFIAQNKLNPVFVDNCLKGVSKTHKGFTIKYQD